MRKGQLRKPANAALICERIAEGFTLKQIGREIGCSDSAITLWAANDPEFASMYARAREAQAEHFAAELLEIADDGSNDWIERESGGASVIVPDHEHINRSRLRVDARKWLMARMAPRRWGDRQEITGADGGPLLVITGVARAEDKS